MSVNLKNTSIQNECRRDSCVGATDMAGASLPTPSWMRLVPDFQQPAISLIAIVGAFGENFDANVAAFYGGGQLPLDQVPVRDRGDSDRDLFVLDLHGNTWPIGGLGCKK